MEGNSFTLSTTTCLAFHTCSTGIPAMSEFGSSSAALFTVSLAPIDARGVGMCECQTSPSQKAAKEGRGKRGVYR